jgi:hypothetical protein
MAMPCYRIWELHSAVYHIWVRVVIWYYVWLSVKNMQKIQQLPELPTITPRDEMLIKWRWQLDLALNSSPYYIEKPKQRLVCNLFSLMSALNSPSRSRENSGAYSTVVLCGSRVGYVPSENYLKYLYAYRVAGKVPWSILKVWAWSNPDKKFWFIVLQRGL